MGTDCCQWCSDVAGKYEMKDQPQGIFRRHDNCDCTIIYDGQVLRGQTGAEGKRGKKWVEIPNSVEAVALKVFSNKEAKELEHEILLAAKPGKDDNAIADMQLIFSKEFADKFKGKYANENVENAVIKACRQLVKNRNGTLFEEAFFIDAETGKTLSYIKCKTKNSINMTKKLNKTLTNAREKSIIMIHNHPNSSPFSRADYLASSDFSSCYETIAVGHNGTVFSFKNTFGTRGNYLGFFDENGKQYPYYEAIRDYRISYSKHLSRGKNDFEARHSAWKDVSEMRGFIYEKR